jgi:hypothetical protein
VTATDTHKPRKDAGPSFLAVAKMGKTNAQGLRLFLATAHKKKPDYILSKDDIQNVSAYILSLRE